ncbi:CHAP domain-containing protein [Candidatus Saccharibacteria bacterium oral taxon 488]|nr:CHAP domain-containing protein [Candidatus Saccharibacteria bacterium oral taxon 488]
MINSPVSIFGVGSSFRPKRILTLIIAIIGFILLMPMVAIFSLGLPALSFLANAPSAKAAEERGFYNGGAMPDNTYAWGNCTWWSYAMRKWAGSPIPNNWGNANTWDDYARRDGYIVNHTPAAGAIFQTDAGGYGYGHVAYVIAVNQISGEWKISEMNAKGLNVVSQRTFTKEAASSYNFIHNKLGVQQWNPQPITLSPPYGLGR